MTRRLGLVDVAALSLASQPGPAASARRQKSGAASRGGSAKADVSSRLLARRSPPPLGAHRA